MPGYRDESDMAIGSMRFYSLVDEDREVNRIVQKRNIGITVE